MTEKEIKALGFEKQIEEDNFDPFYYYTLDIVEGLSFITQSSDEVKNDKWFVEFWDTIPSIKFKDSKVLKNLIELLNKNKDELETK